MAPDVHNDDSYTGQGRVERRRRDLVLRHCNLVAVEHNFKSLTPTDPAKMPKINRFISTKLEL